MCARCVDFTRTVTMLGDLAVYAHTIDPDQQFIEVMAPALAASLPEPPPGLLPADYDPNEDPPYPGQGR
ncbi:MULTISPECIES: hypothetical protein [unclassified Streptomyces]|uniref:hypothetical protein n=1 Tax=unclassified Streptomyces TaxID=2593676 RepID=UPI002E17B6C9